MKSLSLADKNALPPLGRGNIEVGPPEIFMA